MKTPKTKKPKQGTSTPTSSPGERRKSGRGTSAKKTYEERDSSEDEKELWDGVASWEYEDGRIEKPAKAIRDAANSEDEVESSGADEGVEEEVATPEPEVEEEVATPEPEAEAEAEVVHTPTPPRSSARRASTRSSTNKPPSKASASKTVKSKAKPPRAQAKAKTPKSKPAARPKRGAARQAKDVSEMDLDED